MSLLDRLRGALTKKPAREDSPFASARWRQPPPRRGTRELLVAYREMPWLRAVVEKVTEAVSNVHWRVVQRVDEKGSPRKDYALRSAPPATRMKVISAGGDQGGKIVQVPDHPLLELLNDPNDYLAGRTTTKLIQTYLELPGEAFLALQRAHGVVVGFWPLPPHWVTRLPDLTVPRERRTYTVNAGQWTREIPAADVIHLRNVDPEDPLGRGVGPAFALGDELDTDEYAARFLKSYFFNFALPAAVVSIEGGDPGKETVKRWKEELRREYGGPDGVGRVLVTGGKTSISRFDSSFREMELVKLRSWLKDFLRQNWGVPPEVMGDVSSSNRATVNAAVAIFAELCVWPRMEFLRTEYQRTLMPAVDPSGTGILTYDSPIPADREFQLQVMSRLPEAFSYDEWRGVGGFHPDPNRQGYPLPMPGQDTSQQDELVEDEPDDQVEDEPDDQVEEEPDDQVEEEPEEPEEDGADPEEEAKRLTRGDPAWAKSISRTARRRR